MKKFLLQSAAVVALATPMGAFAQSTGSVDFENEIVVTGSTISSGVGGVVVPDTSKAKGVLTQEIIARQRPGDTILNMINLIPGVSFQNNDPYGSAGGTLRIRGFSADRISLTVDGIPLNDTGNYALYSNQQFDPEIIDQVNVNLGSTDVDSPTAAASGATVNYRTLVPSDDFHAMLSGSAGEYSYYRMFGLIQTGVFTPFGTKAFFSASRTGNNVPFNNYGVIDKQQYNGKIYQPIGDNGDFISIAGHYNQNRNNFFGSVPLRQDTFGGRVVGTGSANRFPLTKDERFYTLTPCTIAAARPGVADTANSCGSAFDYNANPSNTGNVRLASRYTLSDKLIFSFDANFQYTKANGGGTTVGYERQYDINPSAAITTLSPGYFNSAQGSAFPAGVYANRDLNGDGDLLDTVRLVTPSQTQTRRYGVNTSLRYEFDDNNVVRIAYAYDMGRHRQTGEVGYQRQNGSYQDVFPVNDPITDSAGNILQKRDRKSYAILHQVSGEYRGEFFDDMLTATLGIRAPFFRRNLTNNCFTVAVSGTVNCLGTGNTAGNAAYAAANPTFQGPQQRILNYNKVLPNLGLLLKPTDKASLFANYSKGLQVPGTDNLYQSFFFAPGSDAASPKPETTDNFDVGGRYTSGKIQAQVSAWYTRYTDRLASAYDPELDVTVYRNLGRVDKYGVDGNIAYQPIPELTLIAFGSILESKIKDNVQSGVVAGVPTFLLTKGKFESGSAKYSFGGRAEGTLGPISLGIQAKRTGPRYVNDQNLPTVQTVNGVANTVVYGAKAPAYWLVDLDARFSLSAFGLNDRTYFQLNVSNLFDTLYVGGFGGGTSATSVSFVQIGAPRAISGSVVFGF